MANTDTKNNQDTSLAVELLGRPPRAPFVVACRCESGNPQVLAADPVFLEDNIWKPFPAFLWLVCPELKARISDLEQKGMVRKFSSILRENECYRMEFLEGQRKIAGIRLELARKVFQKELPQHIEKILSDTTIAGSKNWHGVKCLHSHVAHYLAYGENPIGRDCIASIGDLNKCNLCKERKTERSQP